jgi:hypothetical protein
VISSTKGVYEDVTMKCKVDVEIIGEEDSNGADPPTTEGVCTATTISQTDEEEEEPFCCTQDDSARCFTLQDPSSSSLASSLVSCASVRHLACGRVRLIGEETKVTSWSNSIILRNLRFECKRPKGCFESLRHPLSLFCL